MKQAMQRTAVLFTVTLLIGTVALSVRLVQAHQKNASAQTQIPAPLTQSQIRQLFPGTTASVATHPDKFVLYAIEPMQMQLAPPKSKTPFLPNSVDGYKITGKAVITDRSEQERLIASAFYTATPSTRSARLDIGMACFNPHHALRLVKNKRVIDVIICFGCGNTQIWENGEQKTGDLPANRDAEEYVASVLRKHHIHQPR